MSFRRQHSRTDSDPQHASNPRARHATKWSMVGLPRAPTHPTTCGRGSTELAEAPGAGLALPPCLELDLIFLRQFAAHVGQTVVDVLQPLCPDGAEHLRCLRREDVTTAHAA